jgi:NAD(P)-dependent dehydrogenase (short-subunit alcohol dehydrogenase family)
MSSLSPIPSPSSANPNDTNTFRYSSLAGKVAVITGSTQGLGEATARLFKERGIRGLIITGRSVERGLAVAASLTGHGCTAHFVPANLVHLDECRSVIQAADTHFGTLDILVNAAAYTGRGSIWDTTPELYDEMMAINTRAPFFLSQYAMRLMTTPQREGGAANGGSIVNISSNASYGSMPMLAPYAISKGALNVLTKNVAYAAMRDRIRVNALAIGWMDTPGEDAIQRHYHSNGGGDGGNEKDGSWKAQAASQQPFGRLLDPAEVARTIAYCASDESGMMTGCVIDMDQSVMGGGPAPIPPPKQEWTQAKGVSYSFQDDDDPK